MPRITEDYAINRFYEVFANLTKPEQKGVIKGLETTMNCVEAWKGERPGAVIADEEDEAEQIPPILAAAAE